MIHIKNHWIKYLLSLTCVTLCFCAVDCFFGKERYLECEVFEHIYIKPWTEIRTSTYEGHVTTTVVHHPEEFYLLCIGQSQIQVEVTKGQYDKLTNGTPVTIRTREGKWTKIKWIPTIN